MKAIKEINMLPTSHVAIADLCRQFDIKQIVDRAMGWVETPGKPSPGDMVVYMVMDILNQRTPLYRIEEKLKDTDVEALLASESPLVCLTMIDLAECWIVFSRQEHGEFSIT